MAKTPPELRRLMEHQRKVDEAKDVILGALISTATEKRISLYDAARELAELLSEDQRKEWLDVSFSVADVRLSRAAQEARERALYPGGK